MHTSARRHSMVRWGAALALVLALLALVGCGGTTVSQAASATAAATVAASPTAAQSATVAARPTAVGAVTVAPRPPSAAPAGSVAVDREQIVRAATWAPGQLRAHTAKHGREGPWPTEAAYDASARETVRIGTAFTYQDRESNAERLGFYDRDGNRFTAVTRDGRRITTHFRPDRGEAYVRGLDRSTYR